MLKSKATMDMVMAMGTDMVMVMGTVMAMDRDIMATKMIDQKVYLKGSGGSYLGEDQDNQ